MYDFVYSLLGLVQKSVSPWHTAAAAAERLEKAGFARLGLICRTDCNIHFLYSFFGFFYKLFKMFGLLLSLCP